jgi:hypothetical protein
MITRRLWRSLTRSHNDQVLFNYIGVRRSPAAIPLLSAIRQRIPPGVIALLSLIGILCLLVLLPSFLATTSLNALASLAPLALATVGTICGLISSNRTVITIVREHETRRLDVASVTPRGKAGIYWLLSRWAYNHSDSLQEIRNVAFGLYVLVGGAMMFVIGGALISTINSGTFTFGEAASFLVSFVVPVYIVLVVVTFDLVQSILTGSTVGMIVADLIREVRSAQPVAIMTFLGVQFAFYAIIAIAGLLLLPPLIGVFFGDNVLVILQAVLFIGGRELLLWGLWQLIAGTLDVSQEELNSVL